MGARKASATIRTLELLLSKSSNLFYQKSLTNHSVGGCGEEKAPQIRQLADSGGKGLRGKGILRQAQDTVVAAASALSLSRAKSKGSPRHSAGLAFRKIFRAGIKNKKENTLGPTHPSARD